MLSGERFDPDSRSRPLLVIIANPTIRELVRWIIQEMELPATITATWRQAIATTVGAHSCIVADLDDIGDKTAGVTALQRSWGDVPLIVLSRRLDVADQAAALGALAGIRKPINVGALMQAFRRAVATVGFE